MNHYSLQNCINSATLEGFFSTNCPLKVFFFTASQLDLSQNFGYRPILNKKIFILFLLEMQSWTRSCTSNHCPTNQTALLNALSPSGCSDRGGNSCFHRVVQRQPPDPHSTSAPAAVLLVQVSYYGIRSVHSVSFCLSIFFQRSL